MFSLFLMLAQPADLPPCDQEAADNGVQLAMNMCAQRDFLIADADMNAQWKVTRAKMQARDEEWARYQGDSDDGRPGYFETLLTAQRAWLAFRDAHCTSEGYLARGGSLELYLIPSCKAQLTRTRTDQLRYLANYPAG